MKNLFIVMLLFYYTHHCAQTSIMPDSLNVFGSVQLHERFSFKAYSIEFKQLISDSRCPKDVICVRAGEAKLLVHVYKNNLFVKETELYIHASGYISKDQNLIAEFDDYYIYGTILSPYPETKNKIKKKDYQLSLLIQPKLKK